MLKADAKLQEDIQNFKISDIKLKNVMFSAWQRTQKDFFRCTAERPPWTKKRSGNLRNAVRINPFSKIALQKGVDEIHLLMNFAKLHNF